MLPFVLRDYCSRVRSHHYRVETRVPEWCESAPRFDHVIPKIRKPFVFYTLTSADGKNKQMMMLLL